MLDDHEVLPHGVKPHWAPAFQFYTRDWQGDVALQSCSVRCRGLWIEMMCLMHQGVPYGHLATEDGPIQLDRLARLIRGKPREVASDLEEMLAAGVYSVTAEGVIYSRRMVRDQALRVRRALGGYKSIGHPRTHPPRVPSTLPSDPPMGVPPSSSSSSSSSSSKKETALSGWRPTARRLLEFLNEKTGKRFEPVDSNLRLIEALLKAGRTEGQIRGVIAFKCREWLGEAKTAAWLRPATLFRASNFAQYRGEIPYQETPGETHADPLP